MALGNTHSRYGSVAMTLHWLIAAAILINIGLGLWMAEFLKDTDPLRFPVFQLHKSVGLTILVLSVARLGWRLSNPIPPLPDTLSPLLKAVARGTHYLLYFLIIALPLSGWALVSASPLGLPTMYFGLFQWPHFPFLADLSRAQLKPLHHDFGFVHVYLAWTAIVLIPIHVCGALYHQFHGEDVLRRMLPGTRVADTA